MDLAKLFKKHDSRVFAIAHAWSVKQSRKILGQGQAVNIEICQSKFFTPVGNIVSVGCVYGSDPSPPIEIRPLASSTPILFPAMPTLPLINVLLQSHTHLFAIIWVGSTSRCNWRYYESSSAGCEVAAS